MDPNKKTRLPCTQSKVHFRDSGDPNEHPATENIGDNNHIKSWSQTLENQLVSERGKVSRLDRLCGRLQSQIKALEHLVDENDAEGLRSRKFRGEYASLVRNLEDTLAEKSSEALALKILCQDFRQWTKNLELTLAEQKEEILGLKQQQQLSDRQILDLENEVKRLRHDNASLQDDKSLLKLDKGQLQLDINLVQGEKQRLYYEKQCFQQENEKLLRIYGKDSKEQREPPKELHRDTHDKNRGKYGNNSDNKYESFNGPQHTNNYLPEERQKKREYHGSLPLHCENDNYRRTRK